VANNFITPQLIARQALANLYETTLMANLVFREYDAEFTGKQGDTVMVKRPPIFTAQEYNRTDGIQVQDITESKFPVQLNHFADVSVAITSEQLTLELDDFNETVLQPAMEAFVQKIDDDLLALRADITQSVGDTAGEMWNSPLSAIAAGRVLDQQKVPASQRRLVVGPVTAAEWLKDPLMNRADARGDTEGLREASLGPRLFGFDPYKTNGIKVPTQVPGASTTEEGIAFHRTAFALITRTLELPRGASQAAIANYRGFGLRVVIDYDMDQKSDVLSIDCLYGTKTIDPNRACIVRGPLVA
jgi:hypothetical protein